MPGGDAIERAIAAWLARFRREGRFRVTDEAAHARRGTTLADVAPE